MEAVTITRVNKFDCVQKAIEAESKGIPVYDLHLSNKLFEQFNGLGKLTNLRKLRIVGSFLLWLPTIEIEKLENLEVLIVEENHKMVSIPETIGKLKLVYNQHRRARYEKVV